MATMIPGDIEEFETEGEGTFYKFIEGVAKLIRFVGLLGLLGCRVHRPSSKAITSDWPAMCAAERAI